MDTTPSQTNNRKPLEDNQAAKQNHRSAPAPRTNGAFGSNGALTPRELEVLDLICQADSTKQIAGKLGITFKPASCHRSRILGKAGVCNTIALFRWAIEHGHVEVKKLGDPPRA
jgi:DNA-binding NarL/FixJ family response regulator